MDDPSDPPPSIDSAFRSVGADASGMEDQFIPPPQPSPAPSPAAYTAHNPAYTSSSHAPPAKPRMRLTHAPEQFVEFYYKTFDGNRAGLGALYVCDSDETQMREEQQMADK